MKNKTSIIIAITAIITISPSLSAQEICDIPDVSILDYRRLYDTQDTQLRVDGWCDSSVSVDGRTKYWDDFGFYKRWWDDGFGFDDPCNPKRPLARVMNSIDLISRGSGYNVKLGSTSFYTWLTKGFTPFSDPIKRLRFKCEHRSIPTASGYAYYPVRTIYLYMQGVYDSSTVVRRASSLVHERGHLAGKWHNGDCVDDVGDTLRCDESWEYKGPYRYQVLYMKKHYENQPFKSYPSNCGYADKNNNDPECYYLSEDHLESLRDRGNVMINRRFENRPHLWIHKGSGIRPWVLSETPIVPTPWSLE